MTREEFKKQINVLVKCTQSDPASRLALLLLQEVRGSKAG